MRENDFYFSNYTYQSKDISYTNQIHNFPTLFHNGRNFVNELLDLKHFEISILYLEKTLYTVYYYLFCAALERSLWT